MLDWKMRDWKMPDWKIEDHGYFTQNIVSVLCMSHCILSDKLFSGGLKLMLLRFYFIAVFTCFQFCG